MDFPQYSDLHRVLSQAVCLQQGGITTSLIVCWADGLVDRSYSQLSSSEMLDLINWEANGLVDLIYVLSTKIHHSLPP